jgi:hypothetical protein
MSVQLVRSEALRFLSSASEEVLCIHGAWGVGKTYAWREFLGDAALANAVALDRYSYVSLFGLNSLNDLKYAIFESTVRVASSTSGPTFGSLQDTLKTLEWTGRKGAALLRRLPTSLVPGSQSLTDLLNSSYFLAVRKQIICLDDLERKGAGFSLTDVMGLVSMLKEERRCKIVLLLNTNALEGDDGKAFATYLEKVVDRSLEFVPTSRESAQIALAGSDDISKQLAEHVIALGISNIRVIKRIEFMARELHNRLGDYHTEVFRRTCQSMVVLAWAYFQPAVAPSLEFLTTKKARSTYDVTDRGEATPQEASWNKLLDNYGYTWTDDFDLALLACIRSGYFDAEIIDKYARPMHEDIVAGNNQDAFRQAWTTFNGSFDDDEDEVVTAIATALRQRVQYVPLNGLNSTIELLKRLGRSSVATELIKFYIENRDENEKFWEIDDHPFTEINDVELQEAIRAKRATYTKATPDTTGLLTQLTEGDGLNSPALAPLAASPVDDFVRVFRATKGNELRHMVEACLRYKRIANPTSDMREIMSRATEALEILGRESTINAERVSRLYGIKIEQKEDPTKSR